MVRLLSCTGCDRHVRADESACPFCGCSLEGLTPRAVAPMAELSRAAAVFIGAATLVGCGKEPAPEPVSPPPAPAPNANDLLPTPAYGPPPVPPTPVSAQPEAPAKDAGAVKLDHSNLPAPAYGPPPNRGR